jgi:hypothetical protein
MADTAIRADRPGARIRRPKQFARGRVCANPDCSTLVSRYNRAESCYRHRSVVYPRIRGRFSEDYLATE